MILPKRKQNRLDKLTEQAKYLYNQDWIATKLGGNPAMDYPCQLLYGAETRKAVACVPEYL